MKRKFILVLVLAASALTGCASASTKTRDTAIRGMVSTGRDVEKSLVKSPLTPGEQALLDAWKFQLDAAQRLVEQGE